MTKGLRWLPGLVLLFAGSLFALSACGSEITSSAPTSTAQLPLASSLTPPPSATPYRIPTNPPRPASGQPTAIPLPTMSSRFFAGSGVCSRCHTGQSDASGSEIPMDGQWAASSMANSARNPFWQAAVSAEALAAPDHSQGIQAFCSTCHMPMAKYTANVFDTPATVLGDGFIDEKNPLHDLAMDGVSCTVCHQIGQNGLGTEASYSGGFVIDAEAPPGSRPAFGPYDTDSELSDVMARQSGFVPIKSDHIGQSELCATCHEVVLQLPGTPSQLSPFSLQATYLEWQQSDARFGQSCQDCHMPDVVSGAYVATQSRQPRSPFRQHTFPGGNVTLLDMLADHGSELGAGYLQDLLDAARSDQRDVMRTQAADVTIRSVRRLGGQLQIVVAVQSRVGHKFPSGFPSRRAWLHVRVVDASGAAVFESGLVGPDGRIEGDDASAAQGGFEPHFRIIDSPDKVQIYEAVLASAAGATTRLAQANGWLKDNRLLPVGYESSGGDDPTAVVGRAAQDDDFEGGGDVVQYDVPLNGSSGPYQIVVELLYQSLSSPWAEAMKGISSVEAERLIGYLSETPPETLLVSENETTFSP